MWSGCDEIRWLRNGCEEDRWEDEVNSSVEIDWGKNKKEDEKKKKKKRIFQVYFAHDVHVVWKLMLVYAESPCLSGVSCSGDGVRRYSHCHISLNIQTLGDAI